MGTDATITYDPELMAREAKDIELEKARHAALERLVEENRRLRALLHAIGVLAKNGQEELL
jgi:hypothetical protein